MIHPKVGDEVYYYNKLYTISSIYGDGCAIIDPSAKLVKVCDLSFAGGKGLIDNIFHILENSNRETTIEQVYMELSTLNHTELKGMI